MIGRIRHSIADFISSEAAGGIVLMLASAAALIVANSPLAEGYAHALHAITGPVIAAAHGPMTVHLWINDGLMAVFFLLVGLEIKGEFTQGRLANWEQRRLPVLAAAAGMLAPALIFLGITASSPGLGNGWAIPAATDIAFAMGVLAILGRRAPPSLKLLLVTIAIVDDMGAVAIIAIAYTAHLDLLALAEAAVVLIAMLAIARWRPALLWPHMLLAALLWYFVFLSGVHATIAGVAAAMAIPEGPRHRLEALLNPWVAFLIVPLFGFANAGVPLMGVSPAILLAPLPLGIALGLFAGKQIGVFGSIWIAARTRFARPPEGASWPQVYGMSLLAGIGFTMSLFIGGLAFPGRPELVDAVKIGVLAGSLLSAVAGYAVLRWLPAGGPQRQQELPA